MINLIPTSVKQARMYGRRNIKLLSYSIAVLFVGLISMSVLLINMSIVSKDQARLVQEMNGRQTELDTLRVTQKDIDKIASQLKVIDKLYQGEVRFSQVLPKIAALLPNGAVLDSLTLTESKVAPLSLDISIDSQQLAAVFQQNLVHSELFDQADISSISAIGSASKPAVKSYAYKTQIVASFRGSKPVATSPPATSTSGDQKTGPKP